MYNTDFALPDMVMNVTKNEMKNPIPEESDIKRMILKNGFVVDPKNGINSEKDIAVIGDKITEVSSEIKAVKGDMIVDCSGLLVVPGLIDMHLHLGDLFEVSTDPIYGSVSDGVTMGLSPGAGNTLMAPSLLGAEIDRGLPMNLGVYLGAPMVLGTMLDQDELIKMFRGELDSEVAKKKMSRNGITIATAPLTVGIKDHMGHFIMSDENINKIYNITDKAEMVFMSHTQDPAHAERLVSLSQGRSIHLAHATAAGCGSHDSKVSGMERINNLLKKKNVSGEFVTTMMRPGLGSREGLSMNKKSQQLAYDALESGLVDILISDGQNDATMKGFGDTRDNIPCILELAEMGVLSLEDSIASMTINPAKLISEKTKNNWWTEKVGHLGVGALANITVINRDYKRMAYTFVNGEMVGFEDRAVRKGNGAGGWVSRFGMVKKTGVGDLVTRIYQK